MKVHQKILHISLNAATELAKRIKTDTLDKHTRDKIKTFIKTIK